MTRTTVALPPFAQPDSLAALLELLAARGPRVLVAGGTDLMVAARNGDLPGETSWISLQNVPELRGVKRDGDRLLVGALTTQAELGAHRSVTANAQAVRDAAQRMASPAVRNRGTLGGNLGTASPAGDLFPPLIVLDAVLTVASPRGERDVAVADFASGVKRNVLADDEVILRVAIPVAKGKRSAFEKIGSRAEVSVSKVSCAVSAVVSKKKLTRVRIALGSVAPTVVRAEKAEALLEGAVLEGPAIEAAADETAKAARPIDDFRSTARYRMKVIPALFRRALSRL